ncbi:MAG TPA: response regulator transcription factor [Verrucomicrobiae bacterium]|nr:response regulator transcription factor [Verrucomicrobiae bacterium]
MRILIAEDEAKVAEFIRSGLEPEGYAVDIASNGDEAIWLAEENAYDALLLDMSMPFKDGLTVVRHLRRREISTPVIFLTASDRLEDKVRGLDAGADDYLTKPFSIPELLARLRAVIRRQRPGPTTLMRISDLELDRLAHQARRASEQIVLTPREFALLEFLGTHSPKAVSKKAIVEHVWEQRFDSGTNVVNVFINQLRKKIDRPGLPPLIHTVRGEGFALRAEA